MVVGTIFGIVLYLLLLVASFWGVFWGVDRIREGFDRYAEWNALRTVPTAPLDSFAFGPVTVEGRVEPLEGTVRAPIGAEACVLYDLHVREWGSTTSKTLFDQRDSEPFAVVTERGRIRVDPAVDLDVSEERTFDRKYESHERRPPQVLAFDRANDVEDRPAGHNRRYRQHYVAPGDRVVVHGRARSDDRYGESAKPAVIEAGTGPFFLSDRSRDDLVANRRWALLRAISVGTGASTVSLAAFLWFSGIAQLFLGASAL